MLRVSRSNLYDRLLEKRQHRSARYSKDDDAQLLPLIRQICSERATNGYRRVTAHLNRSLKEQNWRVNPKRIYRIMQANHLLLAKSGHKKPERCHTGNVVTLKPDTRRCSDGFEIRCWSREVARVVFSLDCCDHETISWSATTGGINSVMVQDLLTESVEKRFGNALYLPHAVEWLTDNGSCYIADSTRTFAASLGFIVCTTPVRSPESNGMAESFFSSLKKERIRKRIYKTRDLARADIFDYIEVFYNRARRHSHLGGVSPEAFEQASS